MNQKSFRKKDIALLNNRIRKDVKDAVQKAVPKIRKQQPRKPQNQQNRDRNITQAGQWLRKAGGIAGGFLGNSELGTSLGAGISRIFGQGDYKVVQNSLMSGPPSFSPLTGGIRFTHREYITDILSSTNYNVNNYRIQPNASTTFPWLSQLAASFEQYKVNGMVVFLNTTSGSAIASTNNALGVWGVTTVYDPSKPPLATKMQAEEYKGCTSGVPSNSILHPVECALQSGVLDRYYVDYSNSVTGEDLKFYDHANINVFTSGQQATGVTLGELWVSYDITFYNPRVMPIGEDNVADHYRLSGASITATNPVGTTAITLPTTGSGLGSRILTTGQTTGVARLELPAGSAPGIYMITYLYSGGTTVASPALGVATVSLNMNMFGGLLASSSILYAAGTGTTANYMVTVIVNKTDNALGTFNLGSSGNVLPTSSAGTFLDIFITPLGSSISSPYLAKMKVENGELFQQFLEFVRINKLNRKLELESPHELEEDETFLRKINIDNESSPEKF